MVSEANEPGSESGKRSDDRRGAARGTRAGSWTPQEGGASSHLAARLPPRSPGSFAAAAMITGQPPSLRRRRRGPERQSHSELRALARARLDVDGAAMRFDDAVADGEPEPHALAER